MFWEVGGIVLILATELQVYGKIASEGQEAFIDENIWVSASAGGTVLLDVEKLDIGPKGLISVKGGAQKGAMGFGGGGKVLINFNQLQK